MEKKQDWFKYLQKDGPASVIVFLVALPLCLGIAMASGAPLFAGLIAGIVGGVVTGALSGSALGVSGPAAGLAVIVLTAIQDLGGFNTFLVAVVLAGIFQVIFGLLRTGVIAYYFPTAVIHGMLAGIGIIIILKQIPHSVGYDVDPEGEMSFHQPDAETTFSELFRMMDHLSLGPIAIALLSLLVLIVWETHRIKKYRLFQLVQGPLIVVILGAVLKEVFNGFSLMKLQAMQVVNIPSNGGIKDFLSNITHPDFSSLLNPAVYLTAFVIAVVGSIETLLSVEASDKMDPWKRVTPANRELWAQGVGNVISGLLGGLPITQVVVRSSVNVQAGARSQVSTILHGLIIFLAVVLIPQWMNKIPLASLAAILFMVGYKLAKPSLFLKTYKQGYEQFIPFLVTILGIVFTDLLTGIGIGLVAAVIFILNKNYRIPIVVDTLGSAETKHFRVRLSEDVSFLKKAAVRKALNQLEDNCTVTIDGSNTFFIHQDVIDVIEDFIISGEHRGIRVRLIEVYDNKSDDPLVAFKRRKTSDKPT